MPTYSELEGELDASLNDDVMSSVAGDFGNNRTEPRTYKDRQKHLNEAWEKVRAKLTQHIIKSASLPSVLCTLCNVNMTTIYCRQCGGYLCNSCTDLIHSSINLFHKPLIWKVQCKYDC